MGVVVFFVVLACIWAAWFEHNRANDLSQDLLQAKADIRLYQTRLARAECTIATLKKQVKQDDDNTKSE